jgi:hypothetical protein
VVFNQTARAGQISGRLIAIQPSCSRNHAQEHVAVDRSTDEPLTLGEILPARGGDPAIEASRRLDWNDLIQQLDEVTQAVLLCMASCEELTGLVKRFRKSRSTIQNHKDRPCSRAACSTMKT